MINNERDDLLNNESATGAAQLVRLGGTYNLTVEGTFSGATVQFQAQGPNGSWINVASGSATANAILGPFRVAAGSSVRCTVTGGSPSALYASLVRAGD